MQTPVSYTHLTDPAATDRKENYISMAKGSVRKKGSKWYYRFYVEDESGKLVQREFAGTASKSETEAMLRKAMEDYEAKKFVAKSENVTVGQMLDMWVEEELKPGSLSNGTVSAYQGTVGRIKPVSYTHLDVYKRQDLNEQAEDMFFRLVEQLAEKDAITEALKAENQMLWVQRMNAVRETAMEIVNHDLIYA